MSASPDDCKYLHEEKQTACHYRISDNTGFPQFFIRRRPEFSAGGQKFPDKKPENFFPGL
jgi:hypothetical protein|tara:strand:- start:214 stop:393 length:180 start_codon:yes stop_codon:yes gene_type:complete